MFRKIGYELIADLLSDQDVHALQSEITNALNRHKGGGVRNAERKFASIRRLVASKTVLDAVSPYLAGKPSFVRAIVFDKTPEKNWLVTWHQDKTVAISQRFECDGWGPWSIKDGVQHVQPPLSVLNQMVTLRLHLDNTNRRNGCLKIIPGSHLEGVMSQTRIEQVVKKRDSIFIEAAQGSALVMRPHLLHASSKALEPGRRRVLHLEFCSYSLPKGINWV